MTAVFPLLVLIPPFSSGPNDNDDDNNNKYSITSALLSLPSSSYK